jgi:hypothetical protein
MSDPLAVYLQDHLAGSQHAIDLVEAMKEKYAGDPLGVFIASILSEIQADRLVLLNVAERVGTGPSQLKEMAAWLSEKVARLKLSHVPAGRLGTFEALEFLEIGIHGKWALWRALATVAESDPRLTGINFEQLAQRAESQRAAVDQRRLEMARAALRKERSAGQS